MGNSMSLEIPKNDQYEVRKENIIPLLILPTNLPLDSKSLDWPLEVQGSGRVLEDGKNFEMRYPKGDLFYSWATIIHESGHLLQDELNPEIMGMADDDQKNLLKEQDAFERGLTRLKKYEPELLEWLENEFIKYTNQGLIPDFASFAELYDNFKKVIKINRTIRLFFIPPPLVLFKSLIL